MIDKAKTAAYLVGAGFALALTLALNLYQDNKLRARRRK